jgi:RND family efflux transporter MFP subunit
MTTLSARRIIFACLTALIALGFWGASVEARAESYNGYVTWRNTLELRAGVSGRVENAAPEPGSSFKVGDELVVIERDLYRSRLNNAEQRLTLLRLEHEEAEKAFERNEILFEEGSLSLVDFDHARLVLERARADLRDAETEWVTARHHVDLSITKAPFDGVVLDRFIATGQYVNAVNQAPTIAVIAEHGKFAVRVDMQAVQRRSLQPGAPATIAVGDRSIDGIVGRIRAATSGDLPAWVVEVNFDAEPGRFVEGIEATVDIP